MKGKTNMDEIKQQKFTTYVEFKKELDTELQKTSESFVRIGWLLKTAMETDILKESGYFNVNDFAKQEYGLDPTQVSRFININTRFSEDGNTPCLKEQYRGIGYAKLAIMLQLPDSVNEEITPAFSKSEIQAIKEEVAAEKQVSDIEIWMEGTPENVQEGILAQVLHQLGHDEKELYAEAFKIMNGTNDGQEIKKLQEALAPAGESIYSVRVQGTGRLLLSIKDTGKDVTITNIRSGEKESHTWQQLVDTWRNIMPPAAVPEESWEKAYGEPYGKEEKKENAPVQQRKKPKVTKAKEKQEKKEIPAAVPEKMTENVSETKESVPKTEENVSKTENSVSETEGNVSKTEETAAKEPETIPAAGQQEEQIAGQTSIQEDFPQYLPEGAKGSEGEDTAGESTGTAAGETNAETVHKERVAGGYKKRISGAIMRLEEMQEQERWQAVITAAKDIQWLATMIMNLEKEEKEDADGQGRDSKEIQGSKVQEAADTDTCTAELL